MSSYALTRGQSSWKGWEGALGPPLAGANAGQGQLTPRGSWIKLRTRAQGAGGIRGGARGRGRGPGSGAGREASGAGAVPPVQPTLAAAARGLRRGRGRECVRAAARGPG